MAANFNALAEALNLAICIVISRGSPRRNTAAVRAAYPDGNISIARSKDTHSFSLRRHLTKSPLYERDLVNSANYLAISLGSGLKDGERESTSARAHRTLLSFLLHGGCARRSPRRFYGPPFIAILHRRKLSPYFPRVEARINPNTEHQAGPSLTSDKYVARYVG